jgi:hypothetical protein
MRTSFFILTLLWWNFNPGSQPFRGDMRLVLGVGVLWVNMSGAQCSIKRTEPHNFSPPWQTEQPDRVQSLCQSIKSRLGTITGYDEIFPRYWKTPPPQRLDYVRILDIMSNVPAQTGRETTD